MAPLQLQILATGSDRIDLPATSAKITAAESTLAEGTPVQLALVFVPVSLPLIGRIDLAGAGARLCNQAAGLGSFTFRGEQIRPWPGAPAIADVGPDGNTLRLRWMHGQSFSGLLLAFLIGAAVAGLLLYLYAHSWSLAAVIAAAGHAVIAGLPLEIWLLLGAAGLIGLVLLRGP